MAKNMYQKREERKNKTEEKVTTTNINCGIGTYRQQHLNPYKY